jgi:hypothetical protein
LKFSVDKDNFIVDGIYYFTNLGKNPIEQNLLYPFPLTNMGYVDSIYIFDLDRNLEIENRKVERFGTFNIKLEPFSTGKVSVHYIQKITSDYCKYVFKSSLSWRRPIESSSFQLKIPKDLKIDSISYQIDSTVVLDKHNVYFWEFKNFYPNKNFEFWFHKAKK